MIFYIFCGVVGFYAALKTENILVFVIFIVIILILSIPGLYFAARIDAQPWTLKVEPSIKTLNVSSFEDFKNRLFQEAEQEGFGDVQTVVSDNNIETVLAFKCEKRELTILQTFWTHAFDERRIYICQTNYKSFDKRFREVEALLLKILNNLLA